MKYYKLPSGEHEYLLYKVDEIKQCCYYYNWSKRRWVESLIYLYEFNDKRLNFKEITEAEIFIEIL